MRIATSIDSFLHMNTKRTVWLLIDQFQYCVSGPLTGRDMETTKFTREQSEHTYIYWLSSLTYTDVVIGAPKTFLTAETSKTYKSHRSL